MKVIAIVGFGFCGRLSFYHLAKKSDQKTKILIFDKNTPDRLGAAFSSFSPHYILNVPTAKMSPFSDQPKKFCEFLQEKFPQVWQEIGEDGFAPRQIYGKYIEQLTEEAFANAKKNAVEVEFVNEEVIKISDEFLLETKNNNRFHANEILLATSFTQSNLPFNFDSKNLVKKLWDKNSLEFHQRNFTNEKICLIGSGLTAVDIIVGLKKKNFAGKIFVISRRGNFPKKHFSKKESSSLACKAEDLSNFAVELLRSSALQAKDDGEGVGVLALCLKIRKFLRENPQFDLRHVVDSIRHSTTALWHNLDEKNKKLFLRFSCYWNIFRHRAPISSVELIEEMIESGQLEVKKKGVKNVSEKNGKIFVQTPNEEIECDYLVNCLGFEFRAEKYPLLAQMIEAGLLKKDLLLAQSNHPKIYLLGGLNIGRDFECTAVPDLRVSVENYFAKNS